MKRFTIFVLVSIFITSLSAQDYSNIPANSVFENFRPFSTPRTNYRPGTVYRIAGDGKTYIVEDITSIRLNESSEGTVTGRMYFTGEEILSMLNIEFERYTYINVEVEIKEVLREFNEQTTVDRVLWENDKAEVLIVDPMSKYYLIRETITAKEITYRFSEANYKEIISGKNNLQKSSGDDLDFPYYITKKYKEPRRLFYLDQRIGLEPYGQI